MLMKKFKYSLITFIFTILFCVSSYAAIYDWPSFGHITNIKTISLSGVKGEKINFNCADLEFKMGLAKGSLNGITITSIPDKSEGYLSLGKRIINAYDRLSRSDINSMIYTPKNNSLTSSITFLPECFESVKTTLSITLNEKKNYPPKIQNASFNTIKNVPLKSTLNVYDKENDLIKINIINKPKKGEIIFEGATFKYTPFLNETGKDRFNVVCIDQAGNYSKESQVEIAIENDTSSFSYIDMKGNPSHYSAIKLYENNILKGDKIGDKYIFEPNKQVSRGEFLMMVITASKLENKLKPCVNTKLNNDSEIPLYLKPYVKLAIDQSIIKEDIFKYNEIPTRAEAVVLVNRASKISNVKKNNINAKDFQEIPTWSIQAYMNLSAYKMLDLYDGNTHSRTALTRDVSADLIWQLYKISNSVALK